MTPALTKGKSLFFVANNQRLLKTDFQTHVFHLQQGFCIAFGIVDRMMRVFCFSKVFEVYKGILLKPFVKRAKIC